MATYRWKTQDEVPTIESVSIKDTVSAGLFHVEEFKVQFHSKTDGEEFKDSIKNLMKTWDRDYIETLHMERKESGLKLTEVGFETYSPDVCKGAIVELSTNYDLPKTEVLKAISTLELDKALGQERGGMRGGR